MRGALVAPQATLTGQTGGFVTKAAAFACLWLTPRLTTTLLPFLLLSGAT